MVINKIITIGLIFLFLGFILVLIGSLFSAIKPEKTNVKSAGILFIGPFPIGWASDKGMFYTLIAITILMLILYFLFFRKF